MQKIIRLITGSIQHNFVALVLLAVVVAVELVYRLYDLKASVSLTIIRAVLYTLLSLAILLPRTSYQTIFRAIAVTLVFSGLAILAIFTLIDPLSVDKLAYEDGLIENLSALFLLLTAVLFIGYAASQLIKRQYGVFGVSLLAAALFFVMGMEEISWMQRILDVESSEFFLAHNQQAETNLHNLNTKIFERLFQLFMLILLAVLPLFREQIAKMLTKFRLGVFERFLPGKWLVLFSVGFACMATIARHPFYMATGMFALAALIYSVYVAYGRRDALFTTLCSIAVALFIGCSAVFIAYGFAYSHTTMAEHGLRSWMPTEYKEFIFAFCIFAYAADMLLGRMNAKATEPKTKRSAALS